MKKTTLFILALVATTITTQVTAQNSLFDLKSYKTTNYERSSLDLNFNLNEQSFYRLQDYENVQSSNFDSGFSAFSDFSKIIHSRKEVASYSLGISLADHIGNLFYEMIDSVQSEKSKTFTHNGNYVISLSFDKKYYYSSSRRSFLILGVDASLNILNNYQIERDIDNPSMDFKDNSNRYDTDFVFKLGHGHGRIENVEDAVEALYILTELAENGLLWKEYSSTDITAFADEITMIRNERYLDERFYRQYSMKRLVEFLENSGLIDSGGIDVYNTISDYHFFAGLNTRPSGQKIEYFITTNLRYDATKSSITRGGVSDEDFTKTNYERLGFNFEYYNSKPLSIKWQRTFYAKAEVGSSDVFQGNAQAGFSCGYYPSTRTKINGELGVMYNFSKNLSGKIDQSTAFNRVNSRLGINSYYYLSTNLRLSGRFNFIWMFGIDSTNNVTTESEWKKLQNIQNDFSLALTYYIF